eukprot:TRINITY_DN2485_c0_g1_i1.p1 TRINITY_DN2485_c0_g1~~TRINITY_DN2485_c0_g1_i1.p1  ORF type:complete len:814 (-),score=192.14 TRINITY_DN2485_c0_g1_i1:728-2863(-)
MYPESSLRSSDPYNSHQTNTPPLRTPPPTPPDSDDENRRSKFLDFEVVEEINGRDPRSQKPQSTTLTAPPLRTPPPSPRRLSIESSDPIRVNDHPDVHLSFRPNMDRWNHPTPQTPPFRTPPRSPAHSSDDEPDPRRPDWSPNMNPIKRMSHRSNRSEGYEVDFKQLSYHSISSSTSSSDEDDPSMSFSPLQRNIISPIKPHRRPGASDSDGSEGTPPSTHPPHPNGHHSGNVVNSEEIGPSFQWQRGDQIGKGGFGNVYVGLNSQTAELFAVKQLEIDTSSDERTKKTLLSYQREVELMKKLNHPNIVRYLGTQLDSHNMYIFLELVGPPGSIQTMLSKFGPLSEKVIQLFTKQVLQGLAYLHSNMIIHRDIKGANILVDSKGVAKLADFGCARLFGLQQNMVSVLGTPFWMAPEVIRSEPYDESADIWSLGCTLIEMATGRPPWCQDFEATAAMYHIASSSEIPQIPSQMSPQALDFLLQCFQRNPKERPDSHQLLQHGFIRSGNYQDWVPIDPPIPSIRPASIRTAPILTILSLPDDLLLRIFSFVAGEDLPALTCVTKRWLKLWEDDMLWRYKTLISWKKTKNEEGIPWKTLLGMQRRHFQMWFRDPIQSKILRGKGHVKSVNDILFTEHHVITASEDRKIKLWNLEKFKMKNTLKGHVSSVNCLSIVEDESRIFSGSSDKLVKLWDLRTRKHIKIYEGKFQLENST